MKKISTGTTKKVEKVASQKLTIGLDLGDRWSWYCVLVANIRSATGLPKTFVSNGLTSAVTQNRPMRVT